MAIIAKKVAAKKVAAKSTTKSTQLAVKQVAKKGQVVPSVNITAEVQAASKALAPAVARLNKALSSLDPKAYPVGMVADLLYELRTVAKMVPNLNAQFNDILEPTIKAVEDHFINTLAVGESSGVQGMRSRVQVTKTTVPTVEDWSKFYEHIRKTKSFDLLNRAVNRAAVTERWDAKKQVPGVGKFDAKKVSVTKLSGK